MKRRQLGLFGSLGLLISITPAHASLFDRLFKADGTYDVIVVGAGAAGLAAAVEAADEGAQVLVLEKQPEIGGNTLISGGYYASVDPVRQKRQGIQDSEDLFYRQTFEYGGRLGNPKLVQTLVKGAQDGLEWLEKLGMHFQPQVIELYGGHWPRCHTPVLPLGQGYIRTLAAAALKKGVRIETEKSVNELVMENSRVVAVKGYSRKGAFTYYAKRGVVLASGSFAANEELVSRVAPKLKGLTTNNTASSTGEPMLAAEKIGANLVNLGFIQCLPGCPSGKKFRVRFHNDVSHFILINHLGKRFVREDGSREEIRDAVLGLPEHFGFIVIDNVGFNQAGIMVQKEAVKAVEGGEAWKADTLEELAVKMGIPSQNLRQTIEEYNRGVRSGKDSLNKVIHKLTIPLEKPPFWACFAGMTIHYTEGGLEIDEKARCLDKEGKPIEALYAAGTITGNVHGKNRLGAHGLADAIVFGRIAGRQAAQNK